MNNITHQHALLRDLHARTLIYQITAEDALSQHLESDARVLYCGFDPTADSLHIGSLIPLLTLRRFQLAGHHPIALIGGATGLIGDPSFKTAERQFNTSDIVAQWTDQLHQQIGHFLDLDGLYRAKIVNNLEWIQHQSLLNFLRDVGKYFSVNQMITKESVKQRLERSDMGISFTEFSYMLIQGSDFSELYRRHQCTLQIGGSDQWGNITCGTELTRRQYKTQVFGLTLPLVTKSDGQKFGKTERGSVWLDKNKTSEYAFYQFWLGTADDDVYRCLNYFTFLEPHIIAEMEQDNDDPRKATQLLAEEVTRIVHGKTGLTSAQRITQLLFSGNIHELSPHDLKQLRQDGLPSSILDMQKLEHISMVQLLSKSGMATSGKLVKDALARNAIWVNGKQKSLQDNMSLKTCFSSKNALHGRFFLVKLGKKKHHLFELPVKNA